MSWRRDLLYSEPVAQVALAPIVRWGIDRHRRTGATPPLAYRAMRKLYGSSPGRWEHVVAEGARDRPLLDLPADPVGLAGGRVEEVVAELERDGFAVLPERLPEGACAEIEASALAATCTLIGGEGDGTHARFVPGEPAAVRYEVPEPDALSSAAAQRIVADESLLAVAQRYLGAAPVQDLVAMWWSAARGEAPSSAAAQQFHFDLDRLRFLKVFVYLTDVDDDAGPHVYVRGSHRIRPAALRRDGRHTDVEVEALLPGRAATITGPRGTVFLADTIGMHKGTPVRRGHRLVFQTEYATSLFGAPHGRPRVIEPVPELLAAVRRHPEAFGRIEVIEGG